jgi:hypothetical protein
VTYLHLAAPVLAMKNFIGGYRIWEYIRKLMDARVVGPSVAKLLDRHRPHKLTALEFYGNPIRPSP